MITLSTHVLDTSLGKPAAGIGVTLRRGPTVLGKGTTDADGRVKDIASGAGELVAGVYSLSFSTASYFEGSGRPSFYRDIVVEFVIAAGDEHYHVPLLLSPYGYSTYRGS